jgi:hypothetical protein
VPREFRDIQLPKRQRFENAGSNLFPPFFRQLFPTDHIPSNYAKRMGTKENLEPVSPAWRFKTIG